MSLSISVFGLGYVGSVSAACFAHRGHRVMGVDVSPAKVEMLASGRSPIIEARMSELVAEGHAAGRLGATTDAAKAVRDSEISFVCVGTPSLRSGKLDLSHIEKVAGEIGEALRDKKGHHVVVLRSTVLPGTTESMLIPILEKSERTPPRERVLGLLQPGVHAGRQCRRGLPAAALHHSRRARCATSGAAAGSIQRFSGADF